MTVSNVKFEPGSSAASSAVLNEEQHPSRVTSSACCWILHLLTLNPGPISIAYRLHWSPCLRQYVDALERIQRRATKMIRGLGKLIYEERSRSIRHVGTLSKSFTRNCLWRFDVKLRHVSVVCQERL